MSRHLRPAALALLASALTFAISACNRANAEAEGRKGDATSAASAVSAPPRAQLSAPSTSNGLVPTGADSAITLRADEGRLLGKPGAMWVVMISDYQCPYCKMWHDSSMVKFERDYVNTGKVRFAYLHLPLTSIHPHARAEAEGAMCAAAQGKFWPYSNSLFAAQRTVGTMSDVTPLLNRIAREQQLDMDQFTSCRQSNGIRSLVEADLQQAQKAGVESTPSFVIGEFMVRGALPYADFSEAIDTALVLFNKRAAGNPAGPGSSH